MSICIHCIPTRKKNPSVIALQTCCKSGDFVSGELTFHSLSLNGYKHIPLFCDSLYVTLLLRDRVSGNLSGIAKRSKELVKRHIDPFISELLHRKQITSVPAGSSKFAHVNALNTKALLASARSCRELLLTGHHDGDGL